MNTVIKNAIAIVNAILLTSNYQVSEKVNEAQLYDEIERKLQDSYRDYYESSGLKAQIEELKRSENSDDKALGIITEVARKGEGGWTATFPNLKTKDNGMDCTLAGAMLHFALDGLGFINVYSTLRLGHYVVTRIFDNGDIKIYDPATTVTYNGIRMGYSRIFLANEVIITNVEKGNGKRGQKIEIIINRPDLPGGFQQVSQDRTYKQTFYASVPTIYLDASCALENIDSLKKDAQKFEEEKRQSDTNSSVWQRQAQQIVEKYPQIAQFDYKKLKECLQFFDPRDILSIHSETPLDTLN